MVLAAIMLGLAMTGPNGLQVLHSPSAEQTQQDRMVERLSAAGLTSRSPSARAPDRPTGDGGQDAAWRADHLTCASPKGRTPGQYRAECGAWLADEAARAAPSR